MEAPMTTTLTTTRRFLLAALLLLPVSACGPADEIEDASEPSDADLASATTTLDPAVNYYDRKTMITLLQKKHPSAAGFADRNAGILLQTDWQITSGRAVPAVWWPAVNWTLTVFQFQTRMARGDFPGVVVKNLTKYVLPTSVATAANAYYATVDDYTAKAPAMTYKDRAAREFYIQKLMWDYHIAAITQGLQNAAPDLAKLPLAEQTFAMAWGDGFVDLLAAANFPTDYSTISSLQALLPPTTVLSMNEYDLAKASPAGLTTAQRTAMIAMNEIYKFQKASNRALTGPLRVLGSTQAGAVAAKGILLDALKQGGNVIAFLKQKLGL
jgi:hypothetical protein